MFIEILYPIAISIKIFMFWIKYTASTSIVIIKQLHPMKCNLSEFDDI